MNNKILEQLKAALEKLTPAQKVALAGITAFALLSLFFLLLWANRPEYGLLYSNLEAADAAQIVDDLKSSNIPYKLKDGGTTILVPAKDIYELRIKYAGQKLISSGAVGYELFDKNNLGLTDFMQKVNLKRALEGELTKTINQIEAIQQSRVHLVIPEPRLFEEEANPASASVVVKLKPNAALTRRQILGITHMVAGSVEGLTPENVTIVDTFGNILTDIVSGDEEVGMTNSQFELKQKVEKYLAEKAQSMLDQVLGKGNSIVKVAATLNFKKVRRKTETFDPDNTAVLSEERNEERSNRPDTTVYERSNVITNYEINKTIEEYEGSLGDIERLSVAVFVNTNAGNLTNTGNSTQQGGARSEEELKKISEIVKLAVGYDPNRHDEIVVHEIPFDRSFIEKERQTLEAMADKEFRLELVRIGLIVLGGVLLLLMFRSMLKRFGLQTLPVFREPEQIPAPPTTERLIGAGEEIQLGEDLYARKLSPEAVARLKAREEITREVTKFAQKEPERVTRLLRYWLLEG